jgi:FkbM family methyltransferase
MKGVIFRTAKRIVETVLDSDIKRIEPGALAVIDRKRRSDAWFCYELQLQELMRAHQIDLAVDVGANDGQFAHRLRQWYTGDIMSFEPVSTPFRRLADAATHDPRWTVHQLALGSVASESTMHVAAYSPFSSLLVANAFARQHFRHAAGTAQETVSVRRLEDVLEPLMAGTPRRRLFLKLDTQGYDMEAFKGIGRYLENVAVMQSEVSLIPIYEGMPHWTESIAAYEATGLYVCGMFPVNRDGEGRVIEYDCVLARSGSTYDSAN